MAEQQALWIVGLAAAALLVRVGQALMMLGQSRARDATAAGVRCLLDLAACVLGFAGLGAVWLLSGIAVPAASFFYLALALIAGAVAASALAERSRLLVGPGVAVLVAALAMPIAGRWTWFGWLHFGAIDTAGAGPIHLLPGTVALACAWLIGPRPGKYNHDGSSNLLPGHAMPLTLAGVLLMLAGWVPYVVGATIVYASTRASLGEPGTMDAALIVGAAMNVLLAAAAGVLVGAAASYQRIGRIDPWALILALLGGLVSVTAAAGAFNPGAAMAAGGVGGLVVPLAATWIDTHLKIDDPLAVGATHGAGGLWALLAAGLFAPTLGQRRVVLMEHQLQIAGVMIAMGVAVAALVAIVRVFQPLRTREDETFEGLDLAEHDINAYPDFQQNLIRSYHLRER